MTDVVRIGPELRVAPPGEPLASLSFRWPEGGQIFCPPWRPPPLFARAPLLRIVGPGELKLSVARFGVEVDGFAALAHLGVTVSGPARWRSLPVAEVDGVAVVHAGPALFIFEAEGEARAHLTRAALSCVGLSGLPPLAEPLAALELGGLTLKTLASWQARPQKLPHGQVGVVMERPTERGVSARLLLRVIDRRVHVGITPETLEEQLRGQLSASGLVRLGDGHPDPGPDGAAQAYPASWKGVPCEVRHAVRQIGRSLLRVDALYSPTAPISALTARRHQDIALSTAQSR